MIKAVFFDLYYTLVRYEPPQEELEARALREFGIDASAEVFRRPLVTANEFIYQEMAKRPLGQRSPEEKMAVYAQYQRVILEEAGIKADDKLVLGLLGKMQKLPMKLVLYDDVAPALDELKGRGLTLGLISNVDHDITGMLEDLRLSPRLDIIITSREAGFSKPQPEIFGEALRRAGLEPAEAAYVGDQYRIDCVGASRAGMNAFLIDRADYYEGVNECPRLGSLAELSGQL